MPLLWLSVSFLTGLILGFYVPWEGWWYLTLGVIGVEILLMLLARRMRWLGFLAAPHPRLKLPPMVLLAALALGGWRISAAQYQQKDDIRTLNGTGRYRVTGMVSEPPDVRDSSTLFTLQVEKAARLDAKGRATPVRATGTMMVIQAARAAWQYGDRLEVEGQPQDPPGIDENSDFSYADYLSRQGIYSYITYPWVNKISSGNGSPILAALFTLRAQAYQVIEALFPPPEAPLLAGILLGMDSDIPDSLMRAFQSTGTAHIIAISGFNIAILAGVFSRLFNKLFSKWYAGGLAIFAVAGYSALVGASPSVIRAAIMGSLGIVAALFGRRSSGLAGLNTLAFSAALMCLQNPFLPWDVSFQLSFGATLGLMLYGDGLTQGFANLVKKLKLAEGTVRTISGWVGDYLLLTLAAQIMTLPVMLFHFQRLSLSALVVNPLVLPAQAWLMILSGIAVVVGLVWIPLARPLAWLAMPLSTYTIRVVELFARLPGGNSALAPPGPTGAVLLFLGLGALGLTSAWWGRMPGRIKGMLGPAAMLAITGLLAAFTLRAALAMPDGRLHLTVFDQDGMATLLLQTPSGGRYLINAGPSANRLGEGLGNILSPVDHSLDAIVIADCRAKALEGLPALIERFPTKAVWWACPAPGGRSGEAITRAMQAGQVEAKTLQPGESLRLEQSLIIYFSPADPEGAGVLITWGKFRALAPGKFEPGGEEQAPGVLVVEGSRLKDIGAEAYQGINPQAVIVTDPQDPNMILPEGWIRVATWGWAAIRTDGEKLWVEQGK